MNKMLLDIPTRFETERLIVRCYEAGDGPMYCAVGARNREHLQRYEAGNVILTAKTEEEAEILVRELYADWVARNCFFMGAFDKKTREFVAQIYVGVVNWDLPEFTIGYFADKEHEGQGFVTEAVRAALRFIFDPLRTHRVRLETNETNTRSRRVAERCGFVQEGQLRESHRDPGGTFSGDVLYGLLRSEYESLVENQTFKGAKQCD
jgi:ribosomal-protein-serine acetyltransferase